MPRTRRNISEMCTVSPGRGYDGKGLRVDSVWAHIDGHGSGVRARLITYTP
ncbi:hypothetical protein ACFVJM_36185 [Streptomyces virginiae]|uniref:hypothetical protein n=1 Tax=Streptomyces virginiae TaxID=1961 RepID=UPI00362904A3